MCQVIGTHRKFFGVCKGGDLFSSGVFVHLMKEVFALGSCW